MSHKPGRVSRMIDLVSLGLIVLGGLLYLRAYFGMEELRQRPHEGFVPGQTVAFARTAEHARLMRVSRIALAAAGVGVIVGLSAAAHAHMIRRRSQPV